MHCTRLEICYKLNALLISVHEEMKSRINSWFKGYYLDQYPEMRTCYYFLIQDQKRTD